MKGLKEALMMKNKLTEQGHATRLTIYSSNRIILSTEVSTINCHKQLSDIALITGQKLIKTPTFRGRATFITEFDGYKLYVRTPMKYCNDAKECRTPRLTTIISYEITKNCLEKMKEKR